MLYKGKLVGVVPAGTSRDVLGLMMAGIPPEEHTSTTGSEQGPAATTASVSDAEGGDHV